MAVYLFVIRRRFRNHLAFLIPFASIVSGVACIIYKYASWATLDVYTNFLKDKFFTRTIGSGGLQIVHGLNYNFNIILFCLTGFDLLCILFLWGLNKNKTDRLIWLMIISAVLHHIVFWGFSTEHDHGVVKMAFPIAFVSASVISTLQYQKRIALASLAVIINISIYFFLHNFYTRKGMYTNPNFCYEVGKTIHEKFKEKDQYVFVNTQGKYLLQIEFYAGKFYTLASSLEEARQILHEKYPKGTGFFIDGDKGDINKVIEFK